MNAFVNDPPRLRILKAICDLLKGINPDNGYPFDLRDDEHGRERVVRGRLEIGNDEPLPMVSLVEPPMTIEGISTKRQIDNTKRVGEYELIVQGWTRGIEPNITDAAYHLEWAVRNRLTEERKRLGGRPMSSNGFFGLGTLVTNMTIGSPVVRPNEHVSEEAVFYLTLNLEIQEDMAVKGS